MDPQPARIYEFGSFRLDCSKRQLQRSDGTPVSLTPKAFDTLTYLVEHAGTVLQKDVLMRAVWADTAVEENNLNQNISILRRALGGGSGEHRYIATVPGRGYQFVARVMVAAEQPAQSQELHASGRSWRVIAAAGAAILIIAVAFLIPTIRRLTSMPRGTAQLEVVPLTALPGQEISPSFSPDGNEVAFGWDGENKGAGFDLYVKVVGTDKPLRLTNHPVPWVGVAWSPNGRYIAVRRMDRKNGGIFLVPALGGPERRLVITDDIFKEGAAISWSPDGKRLAFASHRPATHVNSAQLFLLSLDTLERTLAETPCDYIYDPAFSPNGDKLAYACIQNEVWISLNVRDLRTGKDTRLLEGLQDINGITWSRDGARIVYSRNSGPFIAAAGGDLWQITPGQHGSTEMLPVGNDAASPAVSSSGNRLAYAQSRINANIWRVDLNGSQAHAHILAPSTRQQYDPVISPDGKRIVFMSDRSGVQQIWVCDSDGENAQQLTSFDQTANQTGTPHWSPDSKQIVFDSRVGGAPNVYVVDADGGVPRKLETGTRMNSVPSWSHDGKWIYFASGPTDPTLTIWRVPAAGGQATQVTKTPSFMPNESPDGQYVYFVRTTADKVRLWRIRPDGSDEKMIDAIPPLRTNGYEWWPFGTGIYFYTYPNGKPEVDFLDLLTSRIRRIYTPDKPPAPWLGGLSVSPDRNWLVYSRVDETTSDLMLVENFR